MKRSVKRSFAGERHKGVIVWGVGLAVLALAVGAILARPAGFAHLSDLVFDGYQRLKPRQQAEAPVVVVDITGDHKVIAEVSFTAALTTLHEKAIYLHDARQFQVERFDYEGRKAYVRRVDSDYFTDAIDYTQVKEIDRFAAREIGLAEAAHGEVRVNTQVVGFKKVKFYTLENIGAGNLSMPEQEIHTTAFWLHFPEAFLARFPDLTPAEKQNGIAGLGNLLQAIAALLLMSDPRDLGVALTEDLGKRAFEPDLFLYDNYPGGIGLSAPLFEMIGKLLSNAKELLVRCGCESGCPSCVGPAGEIGERGKEAALRILEQLVG